MFDLADKFIALYHQVLDLSVVQKPSVLLVTGSVLLSVTAIFGTSEPTQALVKKQILSRPSAPPSAPVSVPAEAEAEVRPTEPSSTIPDGLYLYGESPEPEQLGMAYMVFESRENLIVGALYQPRSVFDCFYGTRESQNLRLSVVDSYENTTYTYAVALSDSTVASAGNSIEKFDLQGFHRIEEISDNDTRILETCKASYQDEVWN
ncbi:MAG: hypothetical protein SWY16_08740 [Cyanobacteriota bacterium]|nr:hypothetical protein [Cyanobacteriota bacterium]